MAAVISLVSFLATQRDAADAKQNDRICHSNFLRKTLGVLAGDSRRVLRDADADVGVDEVGYVCRGTLETIMTR